MSQDMERRRVYRAIYSGQERIRPTEMPHNRGWDTRPDPIEKSHINLLYWLITTVVSVVFWVIGLAMVIWLVRLAWRMSIWG